MDVFAMDGWFYWSSPIDSNEYQDEFLRRYKPQQPDLLCSGIRPEPRLGSGCADADGVANLSVSLNAAHSKGV